MDGTSGGAAVRRTVGNSGPGKRVPSDNDDDVIFVFFRSGLSVALFVSSFVAAGGGFVAAAAAAAGRGDGGDGSGGGETESFFTFAIDS